MHRETRSPTLMIPVGRAGVRRRALVIGTSGAPPLLERRPIAMSAPGSLPRASRASLLALAYLAFVSLGLPDAVLGVAWPSLRDGFSLSQGLLGVPVAIAAAAYFLSGVLAGRAMQRLGVGRLLAGSTALVAAAVFAYAAAPGFGVFLLAAPLVGFGSGAIDAALNTYAARHFSPRHMSWLHAAYAAGAMAGPAILTAVLASGSSWRVGYAVVGALLALLVPAFVASRRRWDAAPSGSSAPPPIVLDPPGNTGPTSLPLQRTPPASAAAALKSGRVQLQAGLFFLYSGLEVAAGQWCYTVLTEARGLDAAEAGAWTTAYWGGLLAGRLLLGVVLERVGQVRLLRIAMLGTVAGALLFAVPSLPTAGAALPLLSFSLASIYPGLMSETPRRVGEALAPHAVGFQVSAAVLGVATVPGLAGALSERLGLAAVGWVIVACALALWVLHERLVAVSDRREGSRV